jgi:hypothetical protein
VDKKKTTFSIFEVRSFSADGELFHPVKGETGYTFMKLIKGGYLSLYAYQQENQSRYDGLFLIKRDGKSLTVPNLGFKKYLSQFLDDCEEVSGRVRAGEFEKNEISTIVDSYNECISNRTVDHSKRVVQQQQQSSTISAWDSLEESIRSKDFPAKTDALEMIAEVKRKIRQSEKIPNFLLEGLKNSLQDTELTDQLNTAIEEVNK